MEAIADEIGSVTLREDFPLDQAKRLWEWLNSPRGPNFDDFGPRTFSEFLICLASRRRRERTWGIERQGKLIGYLAFLPASPMAGQFHGLVIEPGSRRRGCGLSAMRQAIDILIADGYRSFLSMPFTDNQAVKLLLLEAAFEHIGILSHHSQRDGLPVGISLYHRRSY